jgi:hypothetical protein
MSVVVASCTLAELFANKTIKGSDGTFIEGSLCLPEYQRSYCWGQTQLQRLLKDLQDYFIPEADSSRPSHLFYLGSVILHQERQGKSSGALNIIDGQQRLTTLDLLARLPTGGTPALSYSSLDSQKQIQANQAWLREKYPDGLRWLDCSQINITLVVTRKEDDAYRFFETQNTGGVRLGGPDIIKAHHLRATPSERRDDFGRLWEELGDLQPLADAVLQVRHWNALNWRPVPSHRQPKEVRTAVVTELADQTAKNKHEDLVFQQIRVTRKIAGAIHEIVADGYVYAMRQPLNAGVNTIHYLQYFQALKKRLLTGEHHNIADFQQFYRGLICSLDGCSYLNRLYDSCLLLYASHFGSDHLHQAALLLFRVVYSRRVTNDRVVRENSVPAFVKETPLFDWILMSYTHEQCVSRLASFTYIVSPKNLGSGQTGVKQRFVNKVMAEFEINVPADNLVELYDKRLKAAIELRIREIHAKKG